MQWKAIYLEDFKTWLDDQEESLQDETLARLDLLEQAGTLLAQPFADTINISVTCNTSHPSNPGTSLSGNLKELRFEFEQSPIRLLYAFVPEQQQIVLIQGVKNPDKRWFKTNLPIAEQKLKAHLTSLQHEELETRSLMEHEKKERKK